MPFQQLRCLLLVASASSMLLLGVSAAQAGARVVPAAPLVSPPYLPPALEIQTPPAPATVRKPRSQALENPLFVLKPPNALLLPEPGVADCKSGRNRSPGANGLTAAEEIENLRAIASGTVQLDNKKLPLVRQQRLQANAAWQIGLLTLHGICGVLNTADAQAWFERAQQLGEPLAPAGLAWCEIEGCKAAANPAAAAKWIGMLGSIDPSRALYLQWLMQSRLAPLGPVPPGPGSVDKPYSTLQNRQLLASAARRGDTNAKIELGLDSVFLNELSEGLVFFKSAASRSVAASINVAVLVERLKNAAAVQPPVLPGSAVKVQPQSAAQNLAQAQRYHRGVGVPSNYTEAIRLYQLAKTQGSDTAKKMLELIFSRPGPDGQIDVGWMQQLAQVDFSGPTPLMDGNSNKQNLKREPTPLFDMLPQHWQKYVATTINA